MTPIESARAKLSDPSLGSLTAEEMAALLSATEPANTRPSRMTWALVDQIIDITNEFPNDKARSVLYDLLTERTSIHIDKAWTDTDLGNIQIGSN